MDKQTCGILGEAVVERYLLERDYRILNARFRCRMGEIDLIARSPQGILCFVEVKTRESRQFAAAREYVTPAKQRRIRAAAALYLSKGNLDCPCRFDVAEVYPDPEAGWKKPEIIYLPQAFE